jgi:DNA-binding IclR family transcriptional regulator
MATILYSRIGKRVPVHCSAVGKALVAFKTAGELKKILKDYVYNIQTPNTITNETDFLAELAGISERGYAMDNQENEPGVRCAAVPIRDHTGQVIAAISISTLVTQVNDEELDQFIVLLKKDAEEISQKMGFGFDTIAR